jgi:hypothetical protein
MRAAPRTALTLLRFSSNLSLGTALLHKNFVGATRPAMPTDAHNII